MPFLQVDNSVAPIGVSSLLLLQIVDRTFGNVDLFVCLALDVRE